MMDTTAGWDRTTGSYSCMVIVKHEDLEDFYDHLEKFFGCAHTVHPDERGDSPCGNGTLIALYAIGEIAERLHQSVQMGEQLDTWIHKHFEHDPCELYAMRT